MSPGAKASSNPAAQALLPALCKAMACLLLVFALLPSSYAHQLRLAYLQLDELEADTYSVLWKLPAQGDTARLAVSVQLPQDCETLAQPRAELAADGYLERWQIRCAGGLAGGVIGVDGLARAAADVLVRLAYLDGSSQVERLTSARPALVALAAPGPLQVAISYLALGVEHILLGVDHLLFVLALLLIVRGTRRLVATVTAFTVAHSITLAMATLGLVQVPIAPVEAVIALSIVFVASEIVRLRAGKTSLTAQSPWVVAFAFGLLHGFGFASVLSEVGLPPLHIPLALLFFNLGVELGQLLFIAVTLVFLGAVRRRPVPLPAWLALGPPYAIGGVAMFWVIQRIAAF